MEVLIVVLLVPVAILLAIFAVLMFLGASREAVALEDYEGDAVLAEEPDRPWWGNPLFWLVVSGVFVLLGFFVWPQLFGGVFLFLPFIWIGGGKSSRRRDRSPQRRPASQ
jgi:nitrogen fixation-related uncharacterized protein